MHVAPATSGDHGDLGGVAELLPLPRQQGAAITRGRGHGHQRRYTPPLLLNSECLHSIYVHSPTKDQSAALLSDRVETVHCTDTLA